MAMKTPGVYIVEKNAFSNSVVEVETAVPAFVGYTEKGYNASDIRPKKISSMLEFQDVFGGAPQLDFGISKPSGLESNHVKTKNPVKLDGDNLVVITFNKCVISFQYKYALYHNMLLYFANGGGPCYVVPVGNYTSPMSADNIIEGIGLLQHEKEPTLIVVPDAVNFTIADCKKIQAAMVGLCESMKNRMAILDVPVNRTNGEYKEEEITAFRTGLGTSSYGTAYYPWLHTSVVSDSDITEKNMEFFPSVGDLMIFMGLENNLLNFVIAHSSGRKLDAQAHQCLLQNAAFYRRIVEIIKEQLNLLPPSAAMAGLYAKVDNARGVWKAPANVLVSSVIKPSINVTDGQQEGLNAPSDNVAAINIIRSFVGEGTKVWGARTLNGHSDDWRYINVRRTMIYMEESIKNATRAYVFEPNDANTWLNLKCMIENFLRSVWKRGGLVGAVPEEAYSVQVGLGETMTAQDILEGIMRVSVLVAVSHPAEFIEITFQQQMQRS